MMKISFLEPYLKLCGSIRRTIELVNRLTERGHDVTIFHSDGSECKWIRCKAKIKSCDEVLDEEHDILIYNSSAFYYLVKKSKAKIKVYYILGLCVHGLDENSLLQKSLFVRANPTIYPPWNKDILLFKKSLQSPFLKLSNSSWTYYWLKKNMKINLRLLIGGVNTEMFYPAKVEKKSDEIRILCSGDQVIHEKEKGLKLY